MCMSFSQYESRPRTMRTAVMPAIAHPGDRLPSYSSCQNQRRGERIASALDLLARTRRPDLSVAHGRLARRCTRDCRARARDLRVEARLLALEGGEAVGRRDR